MNLIIVTEYSSSIIKNASRTMYVHFDKGTFILNRSEMSLRRGKGGVSLITSRHFNTTINTLQRNTSLPNTHKNVPERSNVCK